MTDYPVAQPYESTRRIYICDTDASGLIFFGAVTRWIAEAHTELMASIGVTTMSGETATPTRALQVEYNHPLRMHDVVLQRAWISELGTTSYAVTHEIVQEDRNRVAVVASTRHVAVDLEEMKPRPVPGLVASAFHESNRRGPHAWQPLRSADSPARGSAEAHGLRTQPPSRNRIRPWQVLEVPP